MSDSDLRRQFLDRFEKWPGRINARIVLRYGITGLALGLVLATALALLAWRMGYGQWRWWAWSLVLLGAMAGVVRGWTQRWGRTEVALYLDGAWKTGESITSALALIDESSKGKWEDDDGAGKVVLSRAVKDLERGAPSSARPRVLLRAHMAVPVLAAGLGWIGTWQLPPQPAAPPPPPGKKQVRVADLKELEKVIALEKLRTPDPEQKKRLEQIAARARKLRRKLQQGMEERQAQNEIAKLRDAIASERARLGTGKRRAGLEAARGRLARNHLLRRAARALGDRDLTRFDDEMRKLANQLEKTDRQAAKKALEEAAKAAKERNAPGVAKFLEEQRKLFEERSKRGEALREFARALGDEKNGAGGKQHLPKNLRDASRISKRLAEALSKLSPEERKRLAERMRNRAKNEALEPSTRKQLREMADMLDTPEGQKRLEEMLKKMANEKLESKEAQRDKALEEAERGLGRAQRRLGMPTPAPGAGGPKTKTPSKGPHVSPRGSGGNLSGKPGPGGHHDRGRGDHEGETKKLEGDGFRARVGGPMNPGAPMPGSVLGRTAGRSGETARTQGMGAIGKAAPRELRSVERSEVPEEYREQVGRYFSP